ncbi:MAG: tetratricopeptide repeat protein, partial [Gemmatimonadetes bacterium]|nr:tetratricopeptide repeat protein [Gemmatimonadota bacterium]
HRSGEFEEFAYRLAEMGEKLTLRTFSETRLAFLRDTLESVGDSEVRIAQRLKIAAVLMELARWKECEEQQRHALAEATALANATLVARASNELAQLLQHTNRLGEAEPLMRRALEIDEATLGHQHPTVGRDLNNLATLLRSTHRIEEAEPLMRRALEIDEATLGEHHPNVAVCLNNLAALLQRTNRLGEAEPLIRRALEIDEAAFGKQHPMVAIRLNNLAMLLMEDTNRIEEAEPLIRRSLEIFDTFRRQTGHEHPHFQQVNENYQALQRAIGSNEPD